MIANNTELAELLPAGVAPNPGKLEDVVDGRSPEQVEADMIAQGQADAEAIAQNRDPAEVAAMFFHLFFSKFQQQVMFLSNKELKKLLTSIIGRGHKNMPEIPTFKDRNAGQAYKLGLELLQAKFMMITKLEMDALQAQYDKEAAEAKEIADSAVIETVYGEENVEKK